MTPPFAGWITACVPHYRCHRYIRRAVESLLTQTYPWVRVIVVNDGDPYPPWRELAHIRDPRLVRFSMKKNRGPYFCTELARRATPDPYFLIQDADDWAAPRRAELLLDNLLNNDSDFSFSAQPHFYETNYGVPYHVSVWWGARVARFIAKQSIDETYIYRAPHHGLYRTSALDNLGGYYGGFRIGWDTLLTNLILMIGSISWTPELLYYRFLRSDSLTHSQRTGAHSAYSASVRKCLRQIYRDCYEHYRLRRQEKINANQLCGAIRYISGRYVPLEHRHELEFHASRLCGMMA